MKTKLAILLIIFVLIACGSEHPLKSGYEGVSSSDQAINEVVKKKLAEKGVEFYTFADEGKEVIAYLNKDAELAKLIFDEASGNPPIVYTGLCHYTLEGAEKQLSLLSSNNIHGVTREKAGMTCVYWKKEFSNTIELIDSNYKQIRGHQRLMKN